jgi:hypothetical protein
VRALNNFGSDLLPEIEPLQDFPSFGQRFNAQNLPLWRAVATGGIPGLTATRPHSVDSPLFISVILAGFVPRCSLKRKTQKNLIAYPNLLETCWRQSRCGCNSALNGATLTTAFTYPSLTWLLI